MDTIDGSIVWDILPVDCSAENKFVEEDKCYSYNQWWPAKKDTWINFETTSFIELFFVFIEKYYFTIINMTPSTHIINKYKKAKIQKQIPKCFKIGLQSSYRHDTTGILREIP